MSSIQSFLAIGSIALFSLISLRFNSSVLQNMTLEVENKVYLTAFSLADDMIEEIKQKAFDHETVIFRSINPEELSPNANFGGGKDPGESANDPSTWNDIDDFHGYNKPVSLPHAEGYNVSVIVNYVLANNQNFVSSQPTFFKRVQVTVTSDYLSNPVVLSFIFTLHSKVV
ncbi:MAG: hypothetical protein KGZ85_01365 [Ignavibacterium sp.]|nr:hypothetical protein [Ignavibacterium sp.]